MLQSHLFTKTRKEAPAEETSRNAQLLIRAGYVHKEMAGVYSYMPLGLRVFNNIVGIIREEMNAIGGQEVTLTALQERAIWEPTNQWDDEQVDVWFKTKLKNGTELGLAVTHEPALTAIMKDYVQSYRDLPRAVYQFQTKFRNELRSKSGIMRCREFVMKDLYSFSRTKEEHDQFYEQAKQAYIRIYQRLGLGDVTYLTYASGGMFSQFSHEFQTITDAGEDIIYIDEEKGIAVNEEVCTDEVLAGLGLVRGNLVARKAVEVGNIFTLGTRFSDALGLTYTTEQGAPEAVFMGSYGIGPGRVMGAIVETLSTDTRIMWPASIAPFAVHIIALGQDHSAALELYRALERAGVEVLVDDRDLSAGAKFADADLIGAPHRVITSEQSLEKGGYGYVTGDAPERVVTHEELFAMVGVSL